jgi:rSAM/selenodomain-associated transferase 2
MKLSIIVPVLNESTTIDAALQWLAPLRARGSEVIVVDGGSDDGTPELARGLADRIVLSSRGRATQMNAGAAVARGDVLLFLHADTHLPINADRLVLDGLTSSKKNWGRFDLRFDEGGVFHLIAFMMNTRSRLTGIATGDQAMFMTRAAFEGLGGFPAITLMEDVAFSSRLKRIGRPLCVASAVITSTRRWRKNGVLATIFLMWRLRLSYFLGADPELLARRYGYLPAE